MPQSLYELLVISLATYAVAYYVTQTDGPWSVFYRLRKWAGAEIEAGDVPSLGDADPEPVGRGGIAQMFSCPYCMTPYAVACALILWTIWQHIVILLAAVGLAAFLLRIGEG